MERYELLEIVRDVVADSMTLNRDERDALSETTQLSFALGADSADKLSIMCSLDKKLSLEPKMDQATKRSTFRGFTTIGDLCNYAQDQLKSLGSLKTEFAPSA